MGKLVFGGVLLLVAFLMRVGAAAAAGEGGGVRRASSGVMRMVSLGFAIVAAVLIMTSLVVVIGPGEVGVKHAFGYVSQTPLLPGIRVVEPWSSVERYSTREEQFPDADSPEEIDALSSEQMGMQIDVALRWQIDPLAAPRIFT